MAEHSSRALIRRIIEGMRAAPGTLNGVVDAARTQSPPVGVLPREDVLQRVAPLLTSASTAFIDGVEPDLRPVDQLAADRAVQGIPLAALLDGFQAGRLFLMRQFAEQAKAHRLRSDQVLDTMVDFDACAGSMLNRLIQTYQETALALTRTADATRVEALRRLLHDGPASCIADTGLSASRRYHCIATNVSDPAMAREVEPDVSEFGGISGMVDGYLCVVTPHLPSARKATGYLAVVSPKTRPDALHRAYTHCKQARHAGSRRSLTGLHSLIDLTALLLLDGQPDLADLLATHLLAGLDSAGPLHIELARTALVYLEHGGRIDLTAKDLHLHPNTVKHRLRRLGDLTGFPPPDRADQAFDRRLPWWCALHAWLLHHTGSGDPDTGAAPA